MLAWIYDFATNFSVLLAQLETSKKETAETDAEPSSGLFGSWLFPVMMGVFVLWFIMMMRPQNKENVKAKEMLDKLKKNDRVVTAGGIIGTVVNIKGDGDSIKLRIDDSNNTTMSILKQSIIRVMTDEKSESSDKKS